MKKILVILALGIMVSTMSACETMKGLGKDVEDAGEWVQEKAE
jgi:predicted small secreted protein